MTLNIWNYNIAWPRRRHLIAELLSTYQPDVIGLQETRHDWRFERGEGQAEQIARLTGYHCTSVIAQVYVPLLRVDEGLAILTKEPPMDSQVLHLTLLPRERADENQRICQGITVGYKQGRIHIFNTHLSMSQVARESNAREVRRFVHQQSAGEPALLMGDFNAEPDTPEMRILTAAKSSGEQGAGLTDSWARLNPGQPGYTYASWHPVRRIDYILASNLDDSFISARIIGDAAIDGHYASDHMGVLLEVHE